MGYTIETEPCVGGGVVAKVKDGSQVVGRFTWESEEQSRQKAERYIRKCRNGGLFGWQRLMR